MTYPLRLALSLAAVLFCVGAGAESWWVCGDGPHGSGAGTSEADCFSFGSIAWGSGGAGAVGRGDTLNFCGTFTAQVQLSQTMGAGTDYFVADGTGDACASGERARVENITGTCIVAANRSYVHIKGFEVDTCTAKGIRLQGGATQNCDGCKIEDVIVANAATDGVSIDQAITDTLATPATSPLIKDAVVTNSGQHGCAIQLSATNATIDNCTADGFSALASGWGVYMRGNAENTTQFTPTWTLVSGTIYSVDLSTEGRTGLAVDSVFAWKIGTSPTAVKLTQGVFAALGANEWAQSGNVVRINFGQDPAHADSTVHFVYKPNTGATIQNSSATNASTAYDGIGIGCDFGTVNCRLLRNESYDNPSAGYSIASTDGAFVDGNIAWGSPRCLQSRTSAGKREFYHNSCKSTSTAANDAGFFFQFMNDSSEVIVKNNTFEGAEYGIGAWNVSAPTLTADYNNHLSHTVADEYTFAAGANDLGVTPNFVGGTSPTTAEGFRLKANSPLRRAGLDLNLGNIQDHGNRAFQHPPSIGAWEAGSGDTAAARTAATARSARQ